MQHPIIGSPSGACLHAQGCRRRRGRHRPSSPSQRPPRQAHQSESPTEGAGLSLLYRQHLVCSCVLERARSFRIFHDLFFFFRFIFFSGVEQESTACFASTCGEKAQRCAYTFVGVFSKPNPDRPTHIAPATPAAHTACPSPRTACALWHCCCLLGQAPPPPNRKA